MRTPRSPSPLILLTSLALACSSTSKTTAEQEPPSVDTGAAAAPTSTPRAIETSPPVEHAAVTTVAIDDLQQALKGAIAKAGPAVVSVYSSKTVTLRGLRGPMFGDPFFDFFGQREQQPREFRQQGLGSGFIIDTQGYILTNNHVVDGADEIKVKLADDRELSATLVGVDPPTDLAVLKVEAEGLTPVALGDSDALEVGDFVLAIGNPFGLPQTISSGIVSAKGRANVGIVDYESFIQTDAAVNPGNSGGPLVDLQGRVVGINTAIASRGGGNDGIAFAIPVNMAKGIIEQLRGEGRVVRGHLGVMISELSTELAESFAFEGKHGILVQDVTKDSAADKAGLLPGDIILRLDGEPVTTVAAFRNAIARKHPGVSVALEIWREGKAQTLDVALDEAPGSDRVAAGPKADSRPKLGLGLQDVTPSLRQQLGLDATEGVVITSVIPGSPAASAGLQPGDVLEQVAGTRVTTAKQAVELLRAADVTKGVRLRVNRNGNGRYVVVRAQE